MVNLSMLQPQPVPVLNDDVLQHIFGHLDIYTLYMVAQCSSRFQALAQSTFVRSLKGRFVWRRQFPCADRALRLFGPNVKHLEINRKLNTTNPWPLIDHTQLKSLRICFYRSYRSSTFLLAFIQTLKEKCGPFVAVKTLEFSYEFQTKTNYVADIMLEMQLGYWCPNLETFHYFDGHFNVIAEHIQPATLQCLSTMPFNYNLRLHSLLKQHPDNPIVSVHLYAYDSDTLMIAESLEIDAAQCKVKWNSLRTSFNVRQNMAYIRLTCKFSNRKSIFSVWIEEEARHNWRTRSQEIESLSPSDGIYWAHFDDGSRSNHKYGEYLICDLFMNFLWRQGPGVDLIVLNDKIVFCSFTFSQSRS